MYRKRVGASFYGQLLAIGLLTYVLHEAAHWIVGLALGYPVQFGLNAVTSAVPMTPVDAVLFSLSGPAITVLGAVMAFVLVRRAASLIAYGVLYFAFFMRLVAAGVSLFNLNDEARASQLLGIGTWTIPAIVVIGLGALTVMASRHLRLSWKVNVLAYLVSSIVISAVVGLDMMLRS